jgi:DNA modification methylase
MPEITLHQGHVMDLLRQRPAASVQCCVTSPPYFGLRDYEIEPQVWGGVPGCVHRWGVEQIIKRAENPDTGLAYTGTGAPETRLPGLKEAGKRSFSAGAFCRRCRAWRGSLGNEPDLHLYVRHIVRVFREVRRVLRPDATLWLNLGDSYATNPSNGRGEQNVTGGGVPHRSGMDKTALGLPSKNLCGVPWRVAFALQQDGWYLRSDIIWHKPNPMPESVQDRPTRAHEYLFLLSPSDEYYYDAEAIREESIAGHGSGVYARGGNHQNGRSGFSTSVPWENQATRNKRSVWTIATQPYPGAHFATFPQKLIEPCILAGSRPGDTVLDPFAGAGTTGLVADTLGRSAVLLELSGAYCEQIWTRLADRPQVSSAV